MLEASPYCGFTPTQQIIYSFLVSKSVTSNTDLFESDGQTIRTDDLIEYYQEDGFCTLDLVEMKSSFVSSTLCITPKTYFFNTFISKRMWSYRPRHNPIYTRHDKKRLF